MAMTKTHQHRGRVSKTYGFTGCVNPARCNPAAHGNIRVVDTCRCGAVRVTLVNRRHEERGPWRESA